MQNTFAQAFQIVSKSHPKLVGTTAEEKAAVFQTSMESKELEDTITAADKKLKALEVPILPL